MNTNKEIYTNKEKQKEYTRVMVNNEPIAVIIPFYKSQSNDIDQLISETEGNTIDLSKLIKDKKVKPSDLENVSPEVLERGNARKLFNEKHLIDDIESKEDVYVTTSKKETLHKTAESYGSWCIVLQKSNENEPLLLGSFEDGEIAISEYFAIINDVMERVDAYTGEPQYILVSEDREHFEYIFQNEEGIMYTFVLVNDYSGIFKDYENKEYPSF